MFCTYLEYISNTHGQLHLLITGQKFELWASRGVVEEIQL